jgi:hypothetical protein
MSGCVTTDAPPPADNPAPVNYRALIKAHKEDIFIDPDSVRDPSISGPKLASGPYLSPAGFITPWIVCIRANAKNRMGGYTGKKLTAALFYRGQFIETKGGPVHISQGVSIEDVGAHWCGDHKDFEPFPELAMK